MLYTVQISKIKYIQPSVTAVTLQLSQALSPGVSLPIGDDQPIQNQRQSGDIHGAIHPAYTQKIPAEFRSVLQCHKNGPGRRCGLACYCPADAFCHRLILKDTLQKTDRQLIYGGELTIKTTQPSLFN